ncbi:protein roadkill [Nephila pilipes]|uniref:Protein roadkill n=1 Tax=Nephila pilipes TaxID=299642 RepID=A0A8X6PN15_NEPPI|nr:protein roadkill [Nephila pilipes]
MEKSKFRIEWRIENFKVCPLQYERKICTPSFSVGILRGTVWRLILYPKGCSTRNHTAFYLRREHSDAGIGEIFVDFELSIQCLPRATQIIKSFKNVCFSVNDIFGHSRFPECELENRTVFICTLTESNERNENIWKRKKEDVELLSAELHNMLSDEYFSDLILQCGGREFRVHKAILAARCPKFLAYLIKSQKEIPTLINVSNIISPDSLKLYLSYIYSGKLDLTSINIPSDLYEIARRFEIADLCETMKSFPQSSIVRTEFEAQRHRLIWSVYKKPNFKPLIRIIRVNIKNVRHLIANISVKKNNNGHEVIIMKFKLIGCPPYASVCVAITVIIMDTNKQCLGEFSDNCLLVENIKGKWIFCIKTLGLEIPKKFILRCDFEIYDGKSSFTMVNQMSEKLLFSNFTQLPNDMMKLLKK